ncbi:hypothetical protein TRFO_23682 [Tritrichomonas foetus]|uniref:Peptidase M60 domain-containing protein n=1 Tax=Tritrichomonas foetus TaxID=1144522 RepID=A0A1J4KE35_9EUKA|nr:hypothetical protein TRFO_23682 [Tritrichomonas foetus]|eukprot:OHT07980.1 hypothetical protein TRFO_23682 [Tritrichomonas foetus]
MSYSEENDQPQLNFILNIKRKNNHKKSISIFSAMGCGMSTAAKVAQSQKQRAAHAAAANASRHNSPINTPRNDNLPTNPAELEIQRARSDFQKIMAHVSWIPKPANMAPVVCFSNSAFPLVVSHLCLEEGDTTNVILPAMGGSHLGPGRIILIGQIQLLVQCSSAATEASLFLENLIRWSSSSAAQTRVLLLGLPSHIVPFIQKNLSGFGLRVLTENDSKHINKVHVIICLSNCEFQNELEVFLSRGGSLIVCAQENNPEGEFPMNNLTKRAGIAFPQCPLFIGPLNSPTMKTNPSFTEISRYTLNAFNEKYQKVMTEDPINLNELDSVITSLRYHVQCMEQDENTILSEIYETTAGFLIAQNYITENGFCPDLIQNIAAVLMVEIQSKLPGNFFVGKDFSYPFPGKPEVIESETVTIHVSTQPEGWFSTGYYLPPAVACQVTVADPPDGITIQVGAHSECLTSKPSPWNRWPQITHYFPIEDMNTEISSPFGGLIYVDSTSKKVLEFDIKMTNVMPYPYWPKNWESTTDSNVSYCEIETNFVTFTVLTESMRKVPDIQKFADKIDSLIKPIYDFIGYKKKRNLRVVFDTDLPEEGPLCGYPIVLHNDSFDDIILDEKPTSELFSLLMFFSVLSLPDNGLDADKESSIAHLMACISFITVYPDISPMEYSTVMLPPLFNKIWNIYLRYKNEFPLALKRAREEYLLDKKGSVDMWSVFVQELSLKCNETFKDLIEKPKPQQHSSGGMVMSMSSQSLQGYVLSDEDDNL